MQFYCHVTNCYCYGNKQMNVVTKSVTHLKLNVLQLNSETLYKHLGLTLLYQVTDSWIRLRIIAKIQNMISNLLASHTDNKIRGKFYVFIRT